VRVTRSRTCCAAVALALLLPACTGAGGTAADAPAPAPTPTAPTAAADGGPTPSGGARTDERAGDPTDDPGGGTAAPADDGGAQGEPDGGCEDPLGCYGEPVRLGRFDAEAIPEASGLAASALDPDLLYLLDDRPGTEAIWAVRTDGTMLGALPVAGMDARDGESLANGPCPDGSPCLFVGDIGDNLRSRDDIVVHRVPEPDLSGGLPVEPLAGDVARFRYPDGAHDAEALLVDDAGRVHVVTKAPFDRQTRETGEARLYRAEAFADGVLTDLGPVPVPPPRAPLQSGFVGTVVTGGEHREGRVLLRTYDAVLEYIAPPGDADLAGLAGWTVREVPSAFEAQSEALTWAADGCGYLTAGEMVGDLWLVPCVP
jgi:hypothetical protein